MIRNMKLTEEQAKQIIAKVHKDLNIECENRCPIKVYYFEKDEFYKINYWAGSYDYSNPPEGVKINKTYPYDSITIDDEKGVAMAISHFPVPTPIELNEKGNYVLGKNRII